MRKITALLAVVLLVGCKEPLMLGTEKANPAAEPSGRYQIVESRPDTFFIDTQRGRVWVLRPAMKSGKYDYEPHFWPVPIIDEENKIGMDFNQWRTLPMKFENAVRQMEAEGYLSSEDVKRLEASGDIPSENGAKKEGTR